MDGEVVQEPEPDNGAVLWGAMFMLALFGSCANMPYYQQRYEKEMTKADRIVHQEKVSTNQVQSLKHSFYILTR